MAAECNASAIELFMDGAFAAAADAWKEMAESSSGEVAARCFVNSALCKMELGMARSALRDCDNAIAASDLELRAYVLKGRALEAMGKAGKAMATWQAGLCVALVTSHSWTFSCRSAARDRSDAAVALDLRRLVVSDGKHVEEAETGEKLQALTSSIPAPALSLAVEQLAHATGDSDFDRGIAVGYLMVNTNRLGEAIAVFDYLLALRPDAVAARLGRGSARALGGDLKAAVEDFDAAVAAAPDVADGWKRRGQSRAALGDARGALADLDKAIAIDGRAADPDLYRQRGMIHHKLHNYRAAARDLETALEAFRDKPPSPAELAAYWNVLGLCQLQLGKVDAAAECLNAAVELQPEFKEAWLNLGQTYRDAGKTELARGALETSLKLDADFAAAHHATGLLCYSVGEYSDAKLSFDKAAETHRAFTDRLASSHHLGLCAHAVGEFDDAVTCYDAVLAADPEHVAWYHRELAVYTRDRLMFPPQDSDAEHDLDPHFKEGHCKRLPPALVAAYAPTKASNRRRNRGALSKQRRAVPNPRLSALPPNAQADEWIRRCRPLQDWIQLECQGFASNRRLHRAFGLAALHVATLADAAWGAAAPDLQTEAAKKSSTQVGWRDLYEAASRWRREADPNDAVWWIDRLPARAFAEGFGLQTPMVAGQLEVVRYFPYCDRALSIVKAQVSSMKTLSSLGELGNLRTKVATCRTLDDVYELCGGRDFWVVAPCASIATKGLVLEGTRITLQRKEPDGYDFTIRTPGTPKRWALYDAEMREAWQSATRRAIESRRRKDGRQVKRLAIDAALVMFYYWNHFGPLSRGSAFCGYAVLAGLLVALGFDPPFPPIPPNSQLDWEAILRPAPDDFLREATGWLVDVLLDDTNQTRDCNFLSELPDINLAFPALANRLAVLLT